MFTNKDKNYFRKYMPKIVIMFAFQTLKIMKYKNNFSSCFVSL